MPGRAIPNDWDQNDDGYQCMTVTVPKSTMWRGTAKGLFLDLLDLWRWDPITGDRQEAIDIATAMFDSVQFGGCMIPQFIAYMDFQQTVGTSAAGLVKVEFNRVEYNKDNQFDIINNEWIVPRDGVYLVGCEIGLSPMPSGAYLQTYCRTAQNNLKLASGWQQAEQTGSLRTVKLELPIYLQKNEIVDFMIVHSSATSQKTSVHDATQRCWAYLYD